MSHMLASMYLPTLSDVVHVYKDAVHLGHDIRYYQTEWERGIVVLDTATRYTCSVSRWDASDLRRSDAVMGMRNLPTYRHGELTWTSITSPTSDS